MDRLLVEGPSAQAAGRQRLTRCPPEHAQLLYFTSTSLVGDDAALLFIGEHRGQPNLHHLDLQTQAQRQLTYYDDGWLRSYVYFDGRPYQGFGKASVSLDADRALAYYIHGRNICFVDMQGQSEVLARLPERQMTAFTHVSHDGRYLCVPTIDAAAFEGHPRQTDERVQMLGLHSRLRIFDTRDGRQISNEPVERGWVTHVQFSPTDTNLLLYNHEWPKKDCGIRRLWLFNGRDHKPLRSESSQRSRNDWVSHETWERDGSAVIYHGRYHQGNCFIGRVEPATGQIDELALPPDQSGYGHFSVGQPGALVTDGYYRHPDDPPYENSDRRRARWICRIDLDWQNRHVRWQPIAPHDSSWTSQDEHPHPIFDHATRYIYFTTDIAGSRAVYRLDAYGHNQP